MNNVINLRPRQRVMYRYWAYWVAVGTTAGACGYWGLVALWPDLFHHWLFGLLVVAAALVSNGVAAGFLAQKVRMERAEARRVRAQATLRREARVKEAERLRAAMDAPTQVLRILPPRADWEDRMKMRLLSDLTERTGDLGLYAIDRPTPPGRRSA